jgi:hypothetical protein
MREGFEDPITFEGFSRQTADPALADTLAFLRDRVGTRSVA